LEFTSNGFFNLVYYWFWKIRNTKSISAHFTVYITWLQAFHPFSGRCGRVVSRPPHRLGCFLLSGLKARLSSRPLRKVGEPALISAGLGPPLSVSSSCLLLGQPRCRRLTCKPPGTLGGRGGSSPHTVFYGKPRQSPDGGAI